MPETIKALVLFSGGLDSMLVCAILNSLGIDVLALHFTVGFELAKKKEEYLGQQPALTPQDSAKRIGVKFREVNISDGYLPVLLHPKYGYGSAVNPCTDCHIYMLRHAKRIMEEEGFHFVASGEVVGQRPMSQLRHQIDAVTEDSGLNGYLLRPLSAKKLPKTIPEEKGWVSRDALYGIQGRSRTTQQELAKRFGLDRYPTPAGGGCYIVDKSYARRFLDYRTHTPEDEIHYEALEFLMFGRHFRINSTVKVAVGRDHAENEALKRFAASRILISPHYRKGPVAVVDIRGEIDDEARGDAVYEAGKLVAYYSKEDTDSFSMSVQDGYAAYDIVIPAADAQAAAEYENLV